jgi:hypothetical protein
MLCWALDRPITRDQAMNCARRQQGRSWEIVESAVRDLGACTARKLYKLSYTATSRLVANRTPYIEYEVGASEAVCASKACLPSRWRSKVWEIEEFHAHKRTHTHMHACKHIRGHTGAHTHIIHMHALTQTHTHTQIQTCTHTSTRIRTQMSTRTLGQCP